MKSAILLPVIAIVGAAALSSVFIMDEREKMLVLQFGQVKQVKPEPGSPFGAAWATARMTSGR